MVRLSILALLGSLSLSVPVWAHDIQVPFVGCQSDGQTGAIPAPRNNGRAPKLPAPLAAHLAWYASNNTGGVLAPRGWRCFELYGSNGSVFMISPNSFGNDPFAAKLSGPAVQLSISFADTSGRFEAARIAARLFPARRSFVDSVISEDIEPRSNFVFGPFSHDHIRRMNIDYVEFETPAGMNGMGTMSRLLKSGDPLHGLVWMDRNNNATMLAVRLAKGQAELADHIIAAMKPR